jgi:hypothetical protein
MQYFVSDHQPSASPYPHPGYEARWPVQEGVADAHAPCTCYIKAGVAPGINRQAMLQ